jgi:hypothetical protein
MEKEKEQSPGFKKYMKDAEIIKREYALKDHIGRPVMKPGNFPSGRQGMFYNIPGSEDPESPFRKSLSELEITNKEFIIEQENKERKFYDEYLEEEFGEFDFRKVKYSEVPKEITQDQMDAIFILLDDIPNEINNTKKDGRK